MGRVALVSRCHSDLRYLLAGASVALALAAATAARADPPCGSSSLGVTCDSAWDAAFADADGSGWLGGDGAASIALPDGRDAWVFDDSMAVPDYVSAPGAGFRLIHSSVVLTGTHIAGVANATSGSARAIIESDQPGTYFWPTAGEVRGHTLWLFSSKVRQTGAGLWDFATDGAYLARIDTVTWRTRTLTPVADGQRVLWGSAVLDDGRYTYVYGVETGPTPFDSWLHVARAPRGRLAAPWRYWDGHGWNPVPGSSVRMLAGVSQRLSVILTSTGYRVISQQPVFGRDILAYSSALPQGPWGSPERLYTTPDFGPRTYTYDALAHPEHTEGGAMLISYNVNSFDGPALTHPSLYRPRFIRVPLRALYDARFAPAHTVRAARGRTTSASSLAAHGPDV